MRDKRKGGKENMKLRREVKNERERNAVVKYRKEEEDERGEMGIVEVNKEGEKKSKLMKE